MCTKSKKPVMNIPGLLSCNEEMYGYSLGSGRLGSVGLAFPLCLKKALLEVP